VSLSNAMVVRVVTDLARGLRLTVVTVLPLDTDLWVLPKIPSDPSLRDVTDEWVRPILTDLTLGRRLLSTGRTGHVAWELVAETAGTLRA
jgi:hypothetical protein